MQAQGLEPGARVALMMPNVPQFMVNMAAILRAGYTCVNVNPLYTARELEHQLKDSRPPPSSFWKILLPRWKK